MNLEIKQQNLLLSATLNEKVNQLANISLANPVMIGIDDQKLQNVKHRHFSLESEESGKMLSSNEEYNVPSQLVQRYIKGMRYFWSF